MENISERLLDFKTFERLLFNLLCTVAIKLTQQYLAWADRHIMGARDTKDYRLIGSRETTIKTLFGEVAYKRRYYRKNTGEYVFLLDEIMGIDCGCGLVSENLTEQIVHKCLDKSFRKTAADVTNNTGQGISAMGAWGVAQKYSDKISKQEERLRELEDSGVEGMLGNISSKVVFQEFDDVWIPIQKKERQERGGSGKKAISKTYGKPKKKAKKKSRMKPMHIGISYTGSTQSKDGRYSTKDKIAYASFGKPAEFASKFATLQKHCYDMDGVERRITNGDGEGWIRAEAEAGDTILQLDPFHRSEAIIKAVRDKDGRQRLFDAIKEKDVGKVLAIVRELAENAQDGKTKERLEDLYGYFYNNRDILLTWQERGIELPKPPEGVTYRNMGIQESSNCNLLTQRMKHRKGSWSIDGANNMAKLLCIKNTIGFDVVLGSLPEPEPSTPWIEPLSAAQTPEHDGKGYGADWLYAPMPFEDAFKTHGREAIRDMFRCKPISQLAYR